MRFAKGYVMLVLMTTRYAGSATLQLSGASSKITFGDEATLTATCGGNPEVSFVSPREVNASVAFTSSVHITTHLIGVASTCAGRSLSGPCVAHTDAIPPMFYCVFTGVGGSAISGPFSAYTVWITKNDENIGLESRLDCAWPSQADIYSASDYPGDGTSIKLNLTLVYGPDVSGPSAVQIRANGLPGLNTVMISDVPAFSPPPPPFGPPLPPAFPLVFENVMLKDGAFGDATTFEYKASHGKESYTAQHKYMADGKDSTVANDWQSETGAFHPCSGTNCGTTGWVQVRGCQLPHMFAHSPHAEDALPMHSSDLSPSSKPSLVLLRRAGDASESGDMPGRGGHRLCGWITHARHVRVDHGIEG